MTFKSIGLFSFGLLVAVIVYPMLHEGGHSLAAIMAGAKVISVELLPTPNILCNISGVSDSGIAFIGVGGILLPFILSAVMTPKSFWLWYCNALVRGISVLALAITIVATMSFSAGSPVENEDITSVLRIYGDAGVWILIMGTCMIAFLCVRTIKEQPIKRIVRYFGL